MKKIAFILIVAVLTLTCVFAEAGKVKKPQDAPAPSPSATAGSPASAFQQSSDWGKLGQSLQQAWLDAMKSGDTKRRLECFVRVRALDDRRGDQSFLADQGFYVQMWSGTIARGHMNAEDLPDVAGIPIVDSINLASPPVPSNQ